jgi:hypothetical protein
VLSDFGQHMRKLRLPRRHLLQPSPHIRRHETLRLKAASLPRTTPKRSTKYSTASKTLSGTTSATGALGLSLNSTRLKPRTTPGSTSGLMASGLTA